MMTEEATQVINRPLTEEEAIVYMAEGWDTSKPVTDEQWENSYYRKAFEKVRQGKRTWNWAAAIFGSYWFIDHRVYLMACAVAFFHVISWLSSLSAHNTLLLHTSLTILPMLLCGAYGNKVLFSHFNNRYQKSPDSYPYKKRSLSFISNYYLIGVYLFCLTLLDLPRTCCHPDSFPNLFHQINLLQCISIIIPRPLLPLAVTWLCFSLAAIRMFF